MSDFENFKHEEASPHEMAKAEVWGKKNPEARGEDVDDPNKKNPEEDKKKPEYDGSHARWLEAQNRAKEAQEKQVEHPTPEELLASLGTDTRAEKPSSSDIAKSTHVEWWTRESVHA